MDPSTPPRIREWDVLVTYRLNFSYFYFPFLQYTVRNVVPSRLFEPCNFTSSAQLKSLRMMIPKYLQQLENICNSYITLLHFSHDRSKWSSPSFSNTTFTAFQVYLLYFQRCLIFSTIQTYAPMLYLTSFLLKLKSNTLVKRVFFLLNAAFARASLDLISRVHLAAFVVMLSK